MSLDVSIYTLGELQKAGTSAGAQKGWMKRPHKAGEPVTYTVRLGSGVYETDKGHLVHDYDPSQKTPGAGPWVRLADGKSVLPAVDVKPHDTPTFKERMAGVLGKSDMCYVVQRPDLKKADCKHGVPGGDEFKTCQLCHPGQVKPFVRTRKGKLEHVKGWTIEEKAARRAASKESRTVRDESGNVTGYGSASGTKFIAAPADISHPDGSNWTDAKLKKWAKDTASDMAGDFGPEKVEEAGASMFFDMAQGILTVESGLRNYLKHKKGISSSQGRAEYLADEINEGYERSKVKKSDLYVILKAHVESFTRPKGGKLERVRAFTRRDYEIGSHVPITASGSPNSVGIKPTYEYTGGGSVLPQYSLSSPKFGVDYQEKWSVIKQLIRDKIATGELKGDARSIQEERERLSKVPLEVLKQGPKPPPTEMA